MYGLCIQNLALIVSEDCNINCQHCFRGKKNNCVMSDEVIEEVFNQVKWVVNLDICGGEPTLDVNRIKKIVETIILKGIIVDSISITINGSIYSKELLDIFDYFIKYSRRKKFTKNKVYLYISLDKYHLHEYHKLGIDNVFNENVKKYSKSKHFAGFRKLEYDIYNEGNALTLDTKKTDLIVHMPVITYAKSKNVLDLEHGICNIGPLVTISTGGIVTEDNTTFDKQKTIYNYGSIFDDRIDKLLIKHGARIVEPRDFNEENEKLILKFINNEQ